MVTYVMSYIEMHTGKNYIKVNTFLGSFRLT